MRYVCIILFFALFVNAGREFGVVTHFFDEEVAGDADFGHQGVELFLGGGDMFLVSRFGAPVVHLLRIFLQVVKLDHLGVREADKFVAVGADAPMLGRAIVVGVKDGGSPVGRGVAL